MHIYRFLTAARFRAIDRGGRFNPFAKIGSVEKGEGERGVGEREGEQVAPRAMKKKRTERIKDKGSPPSARRTWEGGEASEERSLTADDRE